jgi:hypothetical protein
MGRPPEVCGVVVKGSVGRAVPLHLRSYGLIPDSQYAERSFDKINPTVTEMPAR